MAGPYDITTKYLVQSYPRAWLSLVGHAETSEVEVIDADLSSIAAEADKVLRVLKPSPHLVHLEFQASRDHNMGLRLLRYNLLLRYQHVLPVLSVLVLLRPEALGVGMKGVWLGDTPTGQSQITYEYPVIRVWEQPVQRFLTGPLGLLPLAPLANLARTDLGDVLRTVTQRIDLEATPSEAQTLDVVTFTLMGLRFPPDVVQQLVPGVRNMRESSTYQLILDEGRAEGHAEGRASEARSLLLLLGTRKLGAPDDGIRTSFESITDVARLERMGLRLLDASTWSELLATP